MQFQNSTIREIAVASPMTTKVFEEFKIDYCCGGNVGFIDACTKAGVDPAIVIGKLNEVDQKPNNSRDLPESLDLCDLTDYIVEKHHVFTRGAIERLLPLMDKVARKHGAIHPELQSIKENFDRLADDLFVHMRKEETVLFPFIKELHAASVAGRTAATPPFGTVRNPVRMMMFEHDTAGELLSKIRVLSMDFTLPEGACPSYGALYSGLEELEKDLHRHIHLENNVLFPKTVEKESDNFAKLCADLSPETISSLCDAL